MNVSTNFSNFSKHDKAIRTTYLRLFSLFFIFLLTLLVFLLWTGMLSAGKKQVDGKREQLLGITGGVKVYEDTGITGGLTIFANKKIDFIEDNEPKTIKNLMVVKKISYEEGVKVKSEKDKQFEQETGIILKSGVELFVFDSILDIKEFKESVGIIVDEKENPIKIEYGCENQKWDRLNNTNVLPINYYVRNKSNKTIVIKSYEQFSNPEYIFNLKNFCF
jgi:hypothetical protein